MTAGCLTFAGAALGSDRIDGNARVFILASWATFSGLLLWTFYVAAEPYVRRRWPRMLIGWSRLIDGAWRDPLVGRDLLIGSLAGALLTLVQESYPFWIQWSGEPRTLAIPLLQAWEGIRPTVAGLLSMVPQAAWLALTIALLLVVMRLVVRSERGAAIAVIVLLGLGGIGGQFALLNVVLSVVMVSIFVLTATRFGLLACTTAALVNWPTLAPGAAAPEFVRVSTWIVMAAMIAPGVLGFVTATRGRAQTAWLDS